MAANPDLALWRAVLFNGLNDEDAASWMRSTDFEHVCQFAGVEPESVRRAYSMGQVSSRCKKKAA